MVAGGHRWLMKTSRNRRTWLRQRPGARSCDPQRIGARHLCRFNARVRKSLEVLNTLIMRMVKRRELRAPGATRIVWGCGGRARVIAAAAHRAAVRPFVSRPWIAALVPAMALVSGCDPSINFYGSFFPGWI